MVKRLGGLIAMAVVMAVVMFALVYMVLLTVHEATVVWGMMNRLLDTFMEAIVNPSILIPRPEELIALAEPAAELIMVLTLIYVAMLLLDDL